MYDGQVAHPERMDTRLLVPNSEVRLASTLGEWSEDTGIMWQLTGRDGKINVAINAETILTVSDVKLLVYHLSSIAKAMEDGDKYIEIRNTR